MRRGVPQPESAERAFEWGPRFLNRPLLWSAAFFGLGIWCAARWPEYAIALGLPLFLGGAFLAAARYPTNRLRVFGLVLVFFAAGVMYWPLTASGFDGDPLSEHVRQNRPPRISVEGEVASADITETADSSARFVVHVDTLDDGRASIAVQGRLLIRWWQPQTAVYPGDRVRIVGEPDATLSNVNPGVWSYEDALRVQRIFLSMSADRVTVIRRASWWRADAWIARLRQTQSESLARAIPGSAIAFVKSVWLGDRTALPDDEYLAYTRSGTVHILSVSGVHMALVYASAMAVLRMMVRGRRSRSLIMMAIVIAYVLMTGAAPATVRSGLMLGIYLVYEIFQREPDSPSALGLAALVMLLHDPHVMFDLGAQLSFLSVASLMLFQPAISTLLGERVPYVFREALSISIAVQILPFPLSISVFHLAPLASPLANLIIVPLVTGILWVAFVTCALAPVSLALAILFGHACLPLVWLVRRSAETIGNTPLSYATLTSPSAIALACYALLVLWLYHTLRGWPNSKRTIAFVAMTAVVMAVAWRSLSAPPEAVFLDVGHGDATFVRTPGGTTLLVDGGNRLERFDYGERTVAPFLWARGVTRIDYAVGTHADRDHLGGLVYVLSHFETGALVLGSGAGNAAMERELIQICARRGIDVVRVHDGDRLHAEGATVEVLHPPDAGNETGSPSRWRPESDNDQSIVLRVVWPGMDLLLTGDIEAAAEARLSAPRCDADVLRVPHHGSTTSSTPGFIDAVSPRLAIVSTGELNGRLILRDDIVERYAQRRIPLWRTDVHGGLVLRVNHGRPIVIAERERRGYLRK